MLSLKTLLLPTILSLAAIAAANTDNCPENWLQNTYKGDSKCCYGHMMVVVDEPNAYCCVNYLTAPAQESNEDDWSTADQCFAKIPFTASDYSSLVSSASAHFAITTGPATTEATPTTTSSTTSSSSSSSTGSGSETPTPTPTPTTNAAMPLATAEGLVLGGVAVAGALFVL